MSETNSTCRHIQSLLLEISLSGSTPEEDRVELRDHLASCNRCRLYAGGLALVKDLSPTEALYGPALKHRTLAAIPTKERQSTLKVAFAIAPLAVITMGAFFVVPAWLVHRTISQYLASAELSFAISFAIVYTVGAAAAACFSASVLRRFSLDQALSGGVS